MPGRVGEARETDSQRSAPDGAVGRLQRRSATAGVDIEGWCPPHQALGPTWQYEHPSTRGGPERSAPIDQQVSGHAARVSAFGAQGSPPSPLEPPEGGRPRGPNRTTRIPGEGGHGSAPQPLVLADVDATVLRDEALVAP